MRRRRKTSFASVSLFPFLAVLICTLGVLIVMLVIAAKDADVKATAAKESAKVEAADQQQTRTKKLENVLDFNHERISVLKSVRDDVLAKLESARINRSHLREEIFNLQKRLDSAKTNLIAVSKRLQQPTPEKQTQLASFSATDADAKIMALKQELEQAKRRLESSQKKQPDPGPNRYVIVPHKGGGGTFRRPIFIECTKDEVVLQPLGIRLPKSDFVPPIPPGNMLDSALLKIREYWQRYELAGKEGQPYPLIVVRPDGAETFVMARRAMKSWDDEFGYELVDANKEIDFGKPDNQLANEVKDTIRLARRRTEVLQQRQRQIAQHRARFLEPKERAGFVASGNGGGFVANAGTSNFDKNATSGIRQASASQPLVSQGSSNQRTQQHPPNQTIAQQLKQQAERTKTTRQLSTNTNQTSNGQSKRTAPSQVANTTGQSKSNAAGEGNSALGNPYGDQSLAKKRGNNWALPTRTPGATGYLRPIRVVCEQDYMEFRGANGQLRRISFSPSTSSAIDPMVEEIWALIDSWGIAGSGSFWKPQMRVTVGLQAQQRFLELKGLLMNSGLVIGAGQ